MTIGADVLRTQLDYSHWANRRLIDIARQLTAEELTRDFGTADKSVLGTLVHIYASERTWLRATGRRTRGHLCDRRRLSNAGNPRGLARAGAELERMGFRL